jgi:hypothetical protein
MLDLLLYIYNSVPGSHANVQKLKRMFDSGKDYNLLTMDAIDANDIATLLKLYLRECKCDIDDSSEKEKKRKKLKNEHDLIRTG